MFNKGRVKFPQRDHIEKMKTENIKKILELLHLPSAIIRHETENKSKIEFINSSLAALLDLKDKSFHYKGLSLKELEKLVKEKSPGYDFIRLALNEKFTAYIFNEKQTLDAEQQFLIDHQWREILYYMPYGLGLIEEKSDGSLGLTQCNDRAKKLLKLASIKSDGVGLEDLFDKEEYQQIHQKARHTMKSREVSFIAAVKLRQDDPQKGATQCWLDMAFFISGSHLFAIFEDVTEQKLSDLKRVSLEKQLFLSQRLEAIGKLAGGIAHDFNNMLTSIIGYCSLAKRKYSQEKSLNELLDKIMHSANQASHLTRQLLAYSRKQIVEPRVININNVINEMAKMLRRMLGEDIKLVLALQEDLDNVRIDPAQLEQVIIQTLVNAREAMPEGGSLTIETKNVYLEEEYFESQTLIKDGPYVMVTISDTGIGMSQEERDRAFEPFFSTKESTMSSGLGLAMVYGIVKQNNGYIWIYSDKGQGTSIKIYLPSVSEVSPEIRGMEEKVEASEIEGTEIVLFAEDQEMVRDITVEALEEYGYKVIQAIDGQDALQKATEFKGNIDMLVSDVVMPRMNGVQLAEAIKKLYPGIKILFISGFTDESVIRHGVERDSVNFLQKPYSPIKLVKLVRKILDQQ